MKIKTVRYHLIPIRMATIKKPRKLQVLEKLGPLCTVSENVKWCSCCGKQHGGSSKNEKQN